MTGTRIITEQQFDKGCFDKFVNHAELWNSLPQISDVVECLEALTRLGTVTHDDDCAIAKANKLLSQLKDGVE